MAPLDPHLLTLAQSQHGMLATTQLTVAGMAAPDIVALVRRKVLLHPGRGLYAVAALADPSPEGWHRQLVGGAMLLYPDAVLTGTSALLAHQIPVWGYRIGRPEILRPVSRSLGMSAFHIRRLANREVGPTSPWGPCVPLADALAQHAIDHGIVPGVVSADAALRDGAVDATQLQTSVEAVASWPRSSRAKSMLLLADGRRETVGETRTGLALSFLGYDAVPQVTIRDYAGQFVARVDFLLRGTRVIIEFDGRLKYTAGEGTTLFDEKRREDRLRMLGYVIVRIVWADLDHPQAIDSRIRRALAIAA